MVFAVFFALVIGIPVDLVSIFLILAQTLITLEGEMSMVNYDFTVVRGAHGVTKCKSVENDDAKQYCN